MIATVPDPQDSRLNYLFDQNLDAIQRAVEAAGYVLDRHWLLWEMQNRAPSSGSGDGNSAGAGSAAQLRRDYRRDPSLVLFRNIGTDKRRLLLLFLVGETPTSGIHKIAFRSALDQISALPPWLVRPPADPAVPKIRVMGPTFSGSAISLSIALDKWLAAFTAAGKPAPRVEIISGTATGINKSAMFTPIGQSGNVTFHSTVPFDGQAIEALMNYLVGVSGNPGVAILVESNTAYGDEVRKKIRNLQVLTVPFPLHISQLRREAAKTKPTHNGVPNGLLTPTDNIALPMGEAGEPKARDVIPLFSSLETVSIEQVVTSIFSAIDREPISYIGLFTTDVQDRIFLVRELRKYCPNKVIFLFSTDLLYLHSEANLDFQGSLIITPYPLFSPNQLWTYPFKGDKTRLQFSTQSAQGWYNAMLALLGRDDLMLEYSPPFDGTLPRKPALWLSIVGRNAVWPVRTLPIPDEVGERNSYLYPISSPGPDQTMISAGYRSHSLLMMALLLLISLLCLFPSVILLLQLAREKLEQMELKGRLDRCREWLRSLKLINQSWIGQSLAVDRKFRYDFDRRIYLFSSCISLLIISLGNTIVTLLPDWIRIENILLSQGEFRSYLPGYGILALTLIVLFAIVTWLLSCVIGWMRQSHASRQSRALVIVSMFISLGLLTLAGLALSRLVIHARGSNPSAIEALCFFFRATDFSSGVSLLLPWVFVGLASFCSFFGAAKRLELDERMHLIKAPRENGAVFEPYLNFTTPSFLGLDQLEDRIKEVVNGRIFSIPGSSVLIFIILIPYAGHFVNEHIPSIEGWGFDWFFIAAFYLIPLILGWTLLRFFWLSLTLRRFLKHLGLHPLFSAPINTQEADFQMLPKVSLMSSIPGYSGLSDSLAHAREFFKLLNKAAENQRVTSWPVSTQRNIWVIMSEAEKKLHAAIQAESEGRWREALGPRRAAQHAISAASREIATWMEPHWSELNDESAENRALIRRGRIFMISHVAAFLQYILVQLQNLAGLVSIGFILILLAATSYPFQPRESLLLFGWVSILVVVAVTIFVFVQINRDKVFSLVSGSTPGELSLSRDLIYRVLIHGVVPIVTLLGAQFPETVREIISWLSFFKDGTQ